MWPATETIASVAARIAIVAATRLSNGSLACSECSCNSSETDIASYDKAPGLMVQICQCPTGVLRHHFVWTLRQLLQRLPKLNQPAVAHRDCYVAQEARILGPLDWTMRINFAKLVLAHSGELLQRRREMAWLKRRFVGLGRVPIPRAHILANVATEDMLPDTGAHRLRYRSAQLNREIRNAAPGVDLVSSLGDRLSRT